MQASAALRISLPGLPGSEKIQPGTEADFENDEAVTRLPAFRQPIAGEKNLPGLSRGAIGRVVNVIEPGGVELAALGMGKLRRPELFH